MQYLRVNFTRYILVLLALFAIHHGPPVYAQTTTQVFKLDATHPNGPALSLIGTGVNLHQIAGYVQGTVSVGTCGIQSSSDGISWSTLIAGISCTSNFSPPGSLTSGTVNYVRIHAFTGITGSGSVTVYYAGYVNTPGGGGGGGAVSSVSGDGVNITASPTTGDVIVSMSPYLTFVNSSPSLSAVNTGVLKYNSGTQTFQTSVNGGAFTSLASGSVTGSGTTGTLPLWSGTTALGDSIAVQTGTASIAIAGALNVNGTGVSGVALYAAETSSSDPRGIMSAQYSTNVVGARIQFRKARGTEASPTTIVTGDVLGRLRFSGYDGSNYLQMGSIDINSTGTIASTRVPTTMVFSTATDAAPSVLTAALTLGSNQSATFTGNVRVWDGSAGHSDVSILIGTVGGGFWSSIGSTNGVGNDLVLHSESSDGFAIKGASAVSVPSGSAYSWTNSSSDAKPGTLDTSISRISAGVVGIGNGGTYDNVGNIGDGTHRVAAITGVSLKYGPSGSLTFSATAPTISSGFGTSPSITAGGSAAFRLNVGTGGSASTGVIGLPTATTGWNCSAADVTTPDSFITSQTSSTTTTVSFTNYSRTTGTAIAWTASDILAVSCAAF